MLLRVLGIKISPPEEETSRGKGKKKAFFVHDYNVFAVTQYCII